ncbi:hypothetical protein AAHE18_10G131800 [Arachis hypogaea]
MGMTLCYSSFLLLETASAFVIWCDIQSTSRYHQPWVMLTPPSSPHTGLLFVAVGSDFTAGDSGEKCISTSGPYSVPPNITFVELENSRISRFIPLKSVLTSSSRSIYRPLVLVSHDL